MSQQKTAPNSNPRLFKKAALLGRDTRGATMVEYGAVVACVLVAGYLAFKTLGSNVSTTVSSAAQDIGGQGH